MRSATTSTLLASLLLLLPPGSSDRPTDRPTARTAWTETDWSAHLAAEMGGVAEFRTPDGSRVDILTDEVAYEVDWCRTGKWAEGLGQAMFYGAATGRDPGLILLQKDPQAERRYYLRALVVAAKYGVRLRVVRVDP